MQTEWLMVRNMPPPAVDSGTHQLAQVLAKGEPTMRSHWTSPTIIRRPTIAVLSAAALFVACDQPAAPSRPGGGVLADAQSGTVSAHGSGTVPGQSCDLDVAVCNSGGLKFSFDFSGTTNGTDVVPVVGKWSASDPVTNVQLEFTGGRATVFPSEHVLQILRQTCNITTADGTTLVGGCSLTAQDAASNGGTDLICFSGFAANGSIQVFAPPGICPAQLASGNINID